MIAALTGVLLDDLDRDRLAHARKPTPRRSCGRGCRNPALAAERKRRREDLLQATEAELGKVRSMAEGPRGSLRKADAEKIGIRAGRVVNRFKVAKHFELRS